MVFFHAKRSLAKDFRFCKLCWESEPAEETVSQCPNPSAKWYGVVKCVGGSTAAMINHLRSVHPEQLPDSVSVDRSQNKRVAVDPVALHGWSTHMVLGQLLPVRAVEAGRKVFPQLSGKTALQTEVECQIKEIKMELASCIGKAREFGCKFAVSCDSWKTKCVRQQHYVCLLMDWVDASFERKSCCAYVAEISAPRTASKYV